MALPIPGLDTPIAEAGPQTGDQRRSDEAPLQGTLDGLPSKRLDEVIKTGLVADGTRFLYTIHGAGKLYEGTLLERSRDGHVRLNDSGCWEWPPELFVEEILPRRVVEITPVAAALLRDAAAKLSQSAPTPNSKPSTPTKTKHQAP